MSEIRGVITSGGIVSGGAGLCSVYSHSPGCWLHECVHL